MAGFRKLTVEALKRKCKEVGLPTSGNKINLIERLEEYYSDEEENGNITMINRVKNLEKTISNLQLNKNAVTVTKKIL